MIAVTRPATSGASVTCFAACSVPMPSRYCGMSCTLAATAATGAGGGASFAMNWPIIMVLKFWKAYRPKPTAPISTITSTRRKIRRPRVRGLRGRPVTRGSASLADLLLIGNPCQNVYLYPRLRVG